ncbi:MAG: multicopper oxidase type 3 [Gammaproteobacteria bacterium]|nr:multicopper oxidase type 3 [Gammaproteobacteria bacterium]
MNQKNTQSRVYRLPVWSVAAVCVALFAGTLQAAVPGIAGPSFNLVASDSYTSQPDGASIYSWGYGCVGTPTFLPAPDAKDPAPTCPAMQIPGPTLIVAEGATVTVTLTNHLPTAAGNTSIVFPGFTVTANGGSPGLMAQEAVRNGSVTYTFVANKPGTYAYYSGSQAELQIEMGMYGAVIVLPSSTVANCSKGQYSLAAYAYDHVSSCYDREYLFQFSEMNLGVHQAVDAQKNGSPGSLNVAMDPYQPQYFLVNGRSMPDDMDAPYATSYLHQPYNGNPHMHPGDLMLMRIIEQGRMQHPFHFHGNHARVLARDGNMLVASSTTPSTAPLAGPLLFTTPVVPGQTQDQIFAWTGQNLNWDVYGTTNAHTCNGVALANAIANVKAQAASPGTPTTITKTLAGAGGGSPFDAVTKEWCPDHGKSIPVAPPDPLAVANGLWYGGTPYLGMQSANPTPLPPGAVVQNPDAGYAYMWHSHNEREITTNNVFPGGMMMMLIIDPPTSSIDEMQ